MTATIALPEILELFVKSGYGSFTYDTFETACKNHNSKHNMLWYLNRELITKDSKTNTYKLTQLAINKVAKCIDNVYTNELHLSDVILTIRIPRTLRDDFGSAASAVGLSKSAYLRFLMIKAIMASQEDNKIPNKPKKSQASK